MSTLVPNRFLFRFEFPLLYRASPEIDGELDDWSDAYLLPDFGRIDGQTAIGRLYMGWNETGLFVAAEVNGRSQPFRCNPTQFWKGDNLRICTDMRDTRDIKRGSRHCQQFYFLPTGGESDGRTPLAGAARVPRATEAAPIAPAGSLQVAGRRTGSGYTLEGHIPASALYGFDPAEHPRIGLYVRIEDIELGAQFLTVDDDLYWWVDPSTWPTAVLTRTGPARGRSRGKRAIRRGGEAEGESDD